MEETRAPAGALIPRARRGGIAAVLAASCLLGLAAGPAAAHRLAPSLLEIVEARDGTLDVRFKTPRLLPAGAGELAPELPAHCRVLEDPRGAPEATRDAGSVTLRWSAGCGEPGLVGGRVGVAGLEASATNALVRVVLRDGRRLRKVLHAGEPSFVVPARPSATRVLADYARFGAEHIATGFDHLLFVFGLVLLCSGARALVATVTAFTLGHSVTLSVAALGVVRFPSAGVEVLIAGTLLVLAAELARTPPEPVSALRRRPWTAAFGFGLLHGFGFAGALAEIGLPARDIPLALFSFNAGIEAGQLAFVALLLAAGGLLAPRLREAPGWLRRAPAYGMGGLAAYWCLDRTAALL